VVFSDLKNLKKESRCSCNTVANFGGIKGVA